ncbi:MAG: hypothetical protein WC462_01965 [archaeon]
MEKKFLLGIALVLMFLFCGVSAAELSPNDAMWHGTASIEFDKNVFSVNEPVSGNIVVRNTEVYPLIGGNLVLQLAEGTYSSQNDNVFLEQIIPIDFVLPGSNKSIPFSLNAQSSGNYRLDVYSWVIKSRFVGVSSIFLSPSSKQFTVSGTAKKTRAVINRIETKFNEVAGQQGSYVSPEEKITGSIVIDNNSNTQKSSMEIGVSVCEWDSVSCNIDDEKKFSVPSIPANSSVTVNVELIAPKIPSAYEINMKLYNGNETESVYKNRVIVKGETAKARKVFVNGWDTKNYFVSIILSGSPDYINTPETKDILVKAEVFDGSSLVEETSSSITLIKAGEVIKKELVLNSKSFSSICIKIIKENNVLENECFGTLQEEIQAAYDEAFPTPVEVNWNFDDATSVLSFSLKKNSINAQVKLFSTDKTLFEEKISTFVLYSKMLVVPKENLFLIVDDLDTKQQQLITLNLALPSEKRNQGELGETTYDENAEKLFDCYDNVCGQGFTCTSSSFNSNQGICCKGQCIPSIMFEDQIFSIPLIAWIALLVLIVALIIGMNALKTVRKK